MGLPWMAPKTPPSSYNIHDVSVLHGRTAQPLNPESLCVPAPGHAGSCQWAAALCGGCISLSQLAGSIMPPSLLPNLCWICPAEVQGQSSHAPRTLQRWNSSAEDPMKLAPK